MTHRQIHPLDESGVQPARQAQSLQGDLKSCLCSQAHHVRNPHYLAPPVAFLHLAVDQASCHLPLAHVPPSTTSCEPVSKMSRQSREVQV